MSKKASSTRRKTANAAVRPFNHIFCVTIPRSGHHFFENILRTYFSDELYYCYGLDRGSCCGLVPCANAAGKLVLQKSHDPVLAVPPDLANALYVIQYREPVGQLLSYSEWSEERLPSTFRKEDPSFLQWWTAHHASRMIAFFEKWCRGKSANKLLVEYDSLTADTEAVVKRVFKLVGRKFDSRKFRKVMESVSRIRAPGPTPKGDMESYKPRDRSQSPVLPARLVEAFESVIKRRAPFLNWGAVGAVPPRDEEFDRLVEIADAIDRLSSIEVPPELSERIAASGSGYARRRLKRRIDQLSAVTAEDTARK